VPQSRSVFARNPRRTKVTNPSERDRGWRRRWRRRSKTARVARRGSSCIYSRDADTQHPRANTHRPYVCTVCGTDKRAVAAHSAASKRALQRSMQAGGVLFLTSLSSPGGLYGHSLCRERARAFSTPVLSLHPFSRRHRRRRRRRHRRRRRGFPRQYANAFQRRSDE